MSPPSETRIDHLGHTVFRVSVPGLVVLIDPVLVVPGLRFDRRKPPAWWLPGGTHVDAVFISHAHYDHLHPPSLLGLAPDTRLFAYGGDALESIRALGFDDVHALEDGADVHLGDRFVLRVVPAAESGEGTPQCAFVIETPDVTLLDLVDVVDSEPTRDALAPYRGRIDLAFFPAGGSVQWEGYWNQMDAKRAAWLADWLGPRLAAPCGGALSAHHPLQLGKIERYPVGRSDWLTAAGEVLGHGRLVRWGPPFSMSYRNHELVRSGPMDDASPSSRAEFAISPLVTTFFSGFDPLAPCRRLPGDAREENLQAWRVAGEAIRAGAAMMAELLERCDPAAHRSVTASLLTRTLRRLRAAGCHALAGRIATILPRSTDPDDLSLGLFGVAESMVRTAPDVAVDLREDLLVCLELDEAMESLQRESRMMSELAQVDAARASELTRGYLDGLTRNIDERRPVLGPNHVRVEGPRVGLLVEGAHNPTAYACLAFASPGGVKFQMLSEREVTLLRLCDGRTIGAIVADLSGELGLDPQTVRKGLVELLMGLTMASIHLVDWTR